MSAPTVADVMTKHVIAVESTTSFKEVVSLLAENQISAVPVLGATTQIIGVVSEADLLLKERQRDDQRVPGVFAGPRKWGRFRKATATTVADVMTTKVKTIGPNAPLARAARQLLDGKIRRLFVVDDHGKPIGILARRDVLRVYARSDEDLAEMLRRELRRSSLWAAPEEVTVRVADGEVTLEGQLDRRSEVEWASRLIAAMPGVVTVHNALTFAYDDITAARAR